MVFSPDATATTDSTAPSDDTTEGDLSTVEAIERVNTMLTPFVQLLTVVVQGLTAYTLIKRV